jgi:hypothetical protein
MVHTIQWLFKNESSPHFFVNFQCFKMLVSTPHNTPLIVGDRHNNCEDPITWTLVIRKTKCHLVRFFLTHPLTCHIIMYFKYTTKVKCCWTSQLYEGLYNLGFTRQKTYKRKSLNAKMCFLDQEPLWLCKKIIYSWSLHHILVFI